jgi:hypothetical protein
METKKVLAMADGLTDRQKLEAADELEKLATLLRRKVRSLRRKGKVPVELIHDCRTVVRFRETPAKLMGGFNTLMADSRENLYLANLRGKMIVLQLGAMPMAEADTSVLKAIDLKKAAKWLERASRNANKRTERCEVDALDVFARIVANALPSRRSE